MIAKVGDVLRKSHQKGKRKVSVSHGLLEKSKDSDYNSVEKKKRATQTLRTSENDPFALNVLRKIGFILCKELQKNIGNE